jgi:uncharacterized protein (TIGR03790 family)
MFKLNIFIFIIFCTNFLFAIFPDELLVVVNRESTNSHAIATKYCEQRKIPADNIVEISFKSSSGTFPVEISPETFTEDIWNVVNKEISERGLEDKIVGWIYSVDIPTTITTSPQVSITGLTFVKNKFPEGKNVVKGGYYKSQYYGGPLARGSLLDPKSFSYAMKHIEKEGKPILSMMLGYIGAEGNTVSEVYDYLDKGLKGDRTYPSGDVYFVTNSNVRTTCRIWQVKGGVKTLNDAGIKTVVQSQLPDSSADNVLGIWVGKASMKTDTGCNYLPGSMVDNLTSFGARFQTKSQTKVSEWLRDGATLASGTVTEPYAIWQKFPTSYFWYFYQAGCAAIESFYQATYCPLQQLFIGDALVSPWGGKTPVEIILEKNGEKISASYVIKDSDSNKTLKKPIWFLDGKEISRGKSVIIDLQEYSNDTHYLTVHISTSGFVDLGCYGMVEID